MSRSNLQAKSPICIVLSYSIRKRNYSRMLVLVYLQQNWLCFMQLIWGMHILCVFCHVLRKNACTRESLGLIKQSLVFCLPSGSCALKPLASCSPPFYDSWKLLRRVPSKQAHMRLDKTNINFTIESVQTPAKVPSVHHLLPVHKTFRLKWKCETELIFRVRGLSSCSAPSPPINVLFIVNDPSCWHHVITTPLPRAGHLTYMVSTLYTPVIELEHRQQRTGRGYCM